MILRVKNSVLALIVTAFIFGCSANHPIGDTWTFYEITYKDTDLLGIDYDSYVITSEEVFFDEKTDMVLIPILGENQTGKYKVEDSEKGTKLVISNATDERLNDTYLVTIDDLTKHKSYTNQRIIIQSSNWYMEGQRSLFTGFK